MQLHNVFIFYRDQLLCPPTFKIIEVGDSTKKGEWFLNRFLERMEYFEREILKNELEKAGIK